MVYGVPRNYFACEESRIYSLQACILKGTEPTTKEKGEVIAACAAELLEHKNIDINE
jgi:hypothetical protein